MYFVTTLKHPSTHFNISSSATPTLSLQITYAMFFVQEYTLCKFYLIRFSRIWNSFPPINLTLYMRGYIICYIAVKFTLCMKLSHRNFYINSDDPCSFHFRYPCHNCYSQLLQNFKSKVSE